MQKTRLLMISVDALPRVGGISNYSHYCANALSRMSNESVFLGPKGSCIPKGYKADYKLVVDHDSNSRLRAGKKSQEEILRLEKLIEGIIQKYSLNRILLFHPFYFGPPAINIAKKLNIPCDIVVHGTELTSQYPEIIDSSGDLSPRETDSLPFHLFSTLNQASRIISNSQFTGNLAKQIAPKAKVSVCGCGMPIELFQENQKNFCLNLKTRKIRRLEIGGSTRKMQLCCIGRMVPHKRIDRILDLLKFVDASLVIIGDGPLESELRRKSSDMELDARVSFAGKVDDATKWELLATSDFLMLPSGYDEGTGGYEGFGIVLLEAVSVGTIPVCSGLQGAFDPVNVYEIGLEGLNDEIDAEQTAAMLLEYTSGQDKYAEKANLDIQTINNHLLWNHVAERIFHGWINE